MKKLLTALVLLLISITGHAQIVTTTVTNPAYACDTFIVTVKIKGVTGNDQVRVRIKPDINTTYLFTENVTANFISGYYVIDSLLPTGVDSLTYRYHSRMKCNAASINIFNPSTNNFTDTVKVKKNTLTEQNKIVSYSAINPYYQYVNGTYPIISGDKGDTITSSITYETFASGRKFTGYFEVKETLPLHSKIVSINLHGSQLINTSFDSTTNTYTTLIKVKDNYQFIYEPTYTVHECGFLGGNRVITTKMGCSPTELCKTIQSNYSEAFNKTNLAANIVTKMIETPISAASCNIEKRWKKTVIFVNNGSRAATNINVRLYREKDGNGKMQYTFGLIDSSTVNFRLSDNLTSHIIREKHRTTATNLCGNYRSASTYINGNNYNDTLGTFIQVDKLDVGDSIIVSYELFRCCESSTNYYNYQEDPNNTYLFTSTYKSSFTGALMSYKAHPCDNFYKSVSETFSNSDEWTIKQYNLCTTTHIIGELPDTTIGEAFNASIINVTYNNSVFLAADSLYEIWVKIESEKGLFNKDSIYFKTTDGSKWRAYFISDTTAGSGGWKHERWAKFKKQNIPTGKIISDFFSNSSTINYTMQSYCMAKQPKSAYKVSTYIKETDCSSCLIPIISGGCAVAVQCPGCKTAGTLVRKTTVNRKTFGYADNNNDRIPDNYPTAKASPSNPDILTNRIMFGDTVEISMNTVVWDVAGKYGLSNLAAHNKLLNKAYAILTIPSGGALRIIDTKISYSRSTPTATVTGAVTGNIGTIVFDTASTSYFHPRGRTDSVLLKNLKISYDISLATLNSLGINIGSATYFQPNDTITLTTRFVFDKHIKGAFLEPEIVSQAYMTGQTPSNRYDKPTDYFTDSLPDDVDSIDVSHSFWCEDFGGYMSMVDYNLIKNANGFTAPRELSDCGRNATLSYVSMFPSFLEDYFPNEYRNVLEVTKAKLTVPTGYEIIIDSVRAWTENNGNLTAIFNPKSCTIVKRFRIPVNAIGEINTQPYNTHTISNCANPTGIFLRDEICEYYVEYQYRPTCNNTVALADTTTKKLEIWYNSPLSAGYFNLKTGINDIKTKRFVATLSADSSQTQASTNLFTLQTIKIKNTQQSGTNSHDEYNKNAPNVFAIFKSKSGRIHIQTINGAAYSNGQVFKVGHLNALNYPNGIQFVGNNPNEKDLSVKCTYDCVGMDTSLYDKPDTLMMYFGWSCNGYISNLSDIYNPASCLWVDSVYHKIIPFPVTMDIGLSTTKSILENCDSTAMRIMLKSISQGNFYHVTSSIQLQVPPSVKLCNNNVTVIKNNGTPQGVTAIYNDTTKTYTFDLTGLTNVIGLSNRDSLVIHGCLETTCTQSDTAHITLKTSSVAYCNDTIKQQKSINVLIKPYVPQVRDIITVNNDPVILLPAQTTTTQLTLNSSVGTTSNGNTLQITLPNGVTPTNSIWQFQSGTTYTYNIGAIANGISTVQLDLTTTLNTVQTLTYTVQLIQSDNVICSADTCQRFYTVSASTDTISIINCPFNTTQQAEIKTPTAQTDFCINTNARFFVSVPSGTNVFWTFDNQTTLIVRNNSSQIVQFLTSGYHTIFVNYTVNTCDFADTLTVYVNTCDCEKGGIILGQKGRVTTLSANTNFTQPKYIVEGDLVFSNGIYTVSPNTTFYVKGGIENGNFKGVTISVLAATLNIQGATFTAACDTMWGGIILDRKAIINTGAVTNNGVLDSTEISHAVRGITTLKAGVTTFDNTFKINKTKFLNNKTGISSELNYQNAGNLTSTITNSKFYARKIELKYPYNLATTTNATTLGILWSKGDYANTLVRFNKFYDLNGGISTNDGYASCNIRSNQFYNCEDFAIFMVNPGYTITTQSNILSNTIQMKNNGVDNDVKPFGIGVLMDNCVVSGNTIDGTGSIGTNRNSYGIRTGTGTYVGIGNNTITNTTDGIKVVPQTAQSRTYIKGNVLTNNKTGLRVAPNYSIFGNTPLYCNDFKNTTTDTSFYAANIENGARLSPQGSSAAGPNNKFNGFYNADIINLGTAVTYFATANEDKPTFIGTVINFPQSSTVFNCNNGSGTNGNTANSTRVIGLQDTIRYQLGNQTALQNMQNDVAEYYFPVSATNTIRNARQLNDLETWLSNLPPCNMEAYINFGLLLYEYYSKQNDQNNAQRWEDNLKQPNVGMPLEINDRIEFIKLSHQPLLDQQKLQDISNNGSTMSSTARLIHEVVYPNIHLANVPVQQTTFMNTNCNGVQQRKIGTTNNISQSESKTDKSYSFSVIPNPATNESTVFTSHKEGELLIIEPMTGKILSRVTVENNQNLVSLENYPSGVYIISWENKGKIIERHKLIVIK